MKDELVRAVAAVPVATLLTVSRPGPRRWPWRAALGGLLVTLALADHLGHWMTWTVVAIVALTAAVMPPAARAITGRERLGVSVAMLRGACVVCFAGLATLAAAFIIDGTTTREAISSVADRRGTVFVLAGGLAAIFPGGELIARVLHPFAERLEEDTAGMENAGRIIGWLERALLYSLVLAGAPDAAALVVAGKSIARFPAFSKESFAEYYLIGSLMSLLIALGVGIAVRAALGQSPLPSALA